MTETSKVDAPSGKTTTRTYNPFLILYGRKRGVNPWAASKDGMVQLLVFGWERPADRCASSSSLPTSKVSGTRASGVGIGWRLYRGPPDSAGDDGADTMRSE